MPKAKERLELIYRLNGDVKEVDVFELAPALLGIGQIIQAAHLQLGVKHQVGVNVKPFGRGSFVVDIVLFPQSSYPLLAASTLIIAEAVSKTTDVLAAIGLIRGKVVSLIDAIKKLRGKPTRVEEIQGGQYRYQSDDDSVTVNGNVHQLMQNTVIQRATFYVLGKPTDQPGVVNVETGLKNKPTTAVLTTREEAGAIKEFSEAALPKPEPTSETENPAITLYLKPKRISVEGEPDNWSFRTAGSEVIKIDAVRDQDFLAKVKSGEYRLTHDDLLIAEVVQKQKISGSDILSDTKEIVRVREYKAAPKLFSAGEPVVSRGGPLPAPKSARES